MKQRDQTKTIITAVFTVCQNHSLFGDVNYCGGSNRRIRLCEERRELISDTKL